MTEVRIDDLRLPNRRGAERSLYQHALTMQVDLDLHGIVEEARASTGLSEFGDPALIDRLAVQVAAVEADRGLSGLGCSIIRGRLVGLLAARLRFEDFVAATSRDD